MEEHLKDQALSCGKFQASNYIRLKPLVEVALRPQVSPKAVGIGKGKGPRMWDYRYESAVLSLPELLQPSDRSQSCSSVVSPATRPVAPLVS